MRWILYAPAVLAGLLLVGAAPAMASDWAWDDDWMDDDWTGGIGLCFEGDDRWLLITRWHDTIDRGS